MIDIKDTPNFTTEDAVRIVAESYGLKATAQPLPSERDRNFRIDADTGAQYILKIANAKEKREMLEAEILVMEHLAINTGLCPRVIATSNKDKVLEIADTDGKLHLARLATYLPGITMAKVKRQSIDLLYSLGACLGEIDKALTEIGHPALHREFHWDLAIAPQTIGKHRKLVEEAEIGELIDMFCDDFERNVVPLMSDLRHGVIYNDANDHNVIMGGGEDLYSRNQSVIGVIDFGDMVHSITAGDLAVAIAYAVLDKPDPLDTAFHIVRGYNEKHALTESEISALFGLVCIRLSLSVCLAAYQQQQRPSDEYLGISQDAIKRTLPKLAEIHPGFAEAAFRRACGLEPVAKTPRIIDWIKRQKREIHPLFGRELNKKEIVVFDLSIGSPLVEGDPDDGDESLLASRIFEMIEAAGAWIGIGPWAETRSVYLNSAFSNTDSIPGEYRAVHLGMDFFTEPGTPVFAPLSGKVAVFNDNAEQYSYGPVVILEHETDSGDTFFTLYGLLSRESLDGLEVGQVVEKGQPLGVVGTSDVNGGWTPHMHFQIITDMLDAGSHFPGTCASREWPVWRSLNPDPNLIAGIALKPLPKATPEKSKVLSARRERIGRNLSVSYCEPLIIERGWMQYLFDETGRRYLDAFNNVPHVGHCHPRVVEVARRQMGVLNTNTRYLHGFLQDYAERICSTLPDPLSVCFFVNSGSEANELALRIARAHTGRRDLIVLEGAYHGHTTTLIDISPYKHGGAGGEGAPEWVHTAPVADVYRGPYKAGDKKAGRKYAQEVQRVIEEIETGGRGLCGFIAESCPSVGGQIVFPQGYLEGVYKHVRAAGGVCIADEVQTGYGRTGTHFYAFEEQMVVPDIVVLGKPIGNGHPISAVITTPEIAASFDNGMEFFSTFGGNTVSCAVGMAVLDVVQDEGLQAHALAVGDRLLTGLRILKDDYPIIGDVRGSGLFIGVELVRDHETLEPAGKEAAFVADMMREYGVLLGTDGPHGNVIKIRPPMPFGEEDAGVLLETLARVLVEDFSG